MREIGAAVEVVRWLEFSYFSDHFAGTDSITCYYSLVRAKQNKSNPTSQEEISKHDHNVKRNE